MLLEHYWRAYQGYRIWRKIEQKYHAPLYILMPKEKDEYNYYALRHLDLFMERKKVRDAVVITCDREAIAALGLFCGEGRRVRAEYLPRGKALKLIKYYSLYEFTSKLKIVSFTEPYDTYAENLLGIHGVTKEDLVCFDVFRFGETPKAAPVAYQGDNPFILSFLSRCQCGGQKA